MNRLVYLVLLAAVATTLPACKPEANPFSLPPSRLDPPSRPVDGTGEETLPQSDPTNPTLPGNPGVEPEAGTPEPLPPNYCDSLDLIPVPQETLRLNDLQFANTMRALFSY